VFAAPRRACHSAAHDALKAAFATAQMNEADICPQIRRSQASSRRMGHSRSSFRGGTGNLPVSVGKLPTETEENVTPGKTLISSANVTPIPPGRLPVGAGRLPAPPLGGPFLDYVCRVTSNDGDIGRGHLAASRRRKPHARLSPLHKCSPPAWTCPRARTWCSRVTGFSRSDAEREWLREWAANPQGLGRAFKGEL
jgi:hypothetical protein